MNREATLPFDNSYAQLPERFYARQNPTPVSAPGLIRVNHELARHLGIDPDWLESETGVEVVAGNRIPDGAEPIATVYAGHQFGSWNPQLGDGRAILLGEVVGADGVRYDIQLKGAGRTPYSRGGDGRVPLGPVLREYIVSEAMAALGIATTRTLAAVITGDRVIRESSQPSGVLVRVAQSHIRIGTFEFFAARQDLDALRLLVDHVIQRHYPEATRADKPCRAMLDMVVARQAELIASWQLVGFIHGVMNTDNMLLSGETIDYGPCAFMDDYHPDTVFSSIDGGGRYAYSNQPGIAHWNLSVLAQTLVPLLDEDKDKALESAQEAIDAFPDLFADAHRQGMSKKLGLAERKTDDETLIQDLLTLMMQEKADFTLTFRRLTDLACPESQAVRDLGEVHEIPDAFAPWMHRWRERIATDSQDTFERKRSMHSANPAYIPRNHLVEEVIDAAVSQQDFEPFHKLVDVLARPYEYDAERVHYATPPRPDQVVSQTFCGT